MDDQNGNPRGIDLTEAQKRSRRNRNIALGVALAALVVIFYAITIVRMVPGGQG